MYNMEMYLQSAELRVNFSCQKEKKKKKKKKKKEFA